MYKSFMYKPFADHPISSLCRCIITSVFITSLTLFTSQANATEGSMEYYHYNHQGSLLEVYDAASNKRLLSQAWSPWGERQVLQTNTGNNNTAALLAAGLPVHIGYTGHKELLSTGLTFAGDTRLYDARLKRFLNSDDRTTGGIRGQNRYSYAYNNPMAYIDPDGRTPQIPRQITDAGDSLATFVEHLYAQREQRAATTLNRFASAYLAKRFLKNRAATTINRQVTTHLYRKRFLASKGFVAVIDKWHIGNTAFNYYRRQVITHSIFTMFRSLNEIDGGVRTHSYDMMLKILRSRRQWNEYPEEHYLLENIQASDLGHHMNIRNDCDEQTRQWATLSQNIFNVISTSHLEIPIDHWMTSSQDLAAFITPYDNPELSYDYLRLTNEWNIKIFGLKAITGIFFPAEWEAYLRSLGETLTYGTPVSDF